MADGYYWLDYNFKTIDIIKGSIIDARKAAIQEIKKRKKYAGDGIVIYIYRHRKLIGLVRDWYHDGEYQWQANGSKNSYIIGMDGRVKHKVKR